MAFWDDVVKGAGDLANGTVKAVGNGFNATTKAVGDVAGSAGKEIDKVVNGAKGKFDAKPEEVAMQVLEQVSKLPVVKVDRNQFLMDKFGKGLSQEEVGKLLADGPVNIVSKDKLDKAAKACIMDNVLLSSGASVLAGLPGGIAMAVTIPADVAQYYAMALKLAQELGYIYGFQYLWSEKDKLTEEAQNTLLLYLGVMLGVSGTGALLRAGGMAIGKQALKSIPQKALTKTLYYPILKKDIEEYYGNNIKVISSGREAAREVSSVLGYAKLHQKRFNKKDHEFYISEASENFNNIASKWLNKEIIAEVVDL